MAFTKTTTTGYGTRVGNSLKGMVVGLILFVVATGALFWNERRSVRTAEAIAETQTVTESIPDVSKVDTGLNGKVIHASARADTKDQLTDDEFGVSGAVAIALNRKVEYYQYEEKATKKSKDNLGGSETTTTTYTYDAKWVSKPIDSSQFEDPQYKGKNKVLATVEEKKQYAKDVSFGGYKLPPFLIAEIRGSEAAEVKLSSAQREALKTKAGVDAQVNVNGNVVYFGKNSSAPEIGDVRVTLTKVMPAEISLIAKVNGSTFEEYVAKNGNTFSRVNMGTVSKEKMFQEAQDENDLITWIIRGVGALLVIIGLRAMLGLVPTLLKVVPFLSSVADVGITLVCFIGGLAWSFLIIAIAWLFYRPIIGVPLLIVSVAGIVWLRSLAKKKKAAALAPPVPVNETVNPPQ